MSDTKTQPTAQELRKRKVQLAEQLQKAHQEEQERTDSVGRENAELLAAGEPLPEGHQLELERLRGHIRALLAAIEQTGQAIEQTEERERIAAALDVREELLKAVGECRELAAQESEALDAFAVRFMASRKAQDRLRSLVPNRQTREEHQIGLDASWKSQCTDTHRRHVINMALGTRLADVWEYQEMPMMGAPASIEQNAQELSVKALAWFDAAYGLDGIPGLAEAAAEAFGPVTGKPKPTRVHGSYAGAHQTVEGSEWK